MRRGSRAECKQSWKTAHRRLVSPLFFFLSDVFQPAFRNISAPESADRAVAKDLVQRFPRTLLASGKARFRHCKRKKKKLIAIKSHTTSTGGACCEGAGCALGLGCSGQAGGPEHSSGRSFLQCTRGGFPNGGHMQLLALRVPARDGAAGTRQPPPALTQPRGPGEAAKGSAWDSGSVSPAVRDNPTSALRGGRGCCASSTSSSPRVGAAFRLPEPAALPFRAELVSPFSGWISAFTKVTAPCACSSRLCPESCSSHPRFPAQTTERGASRHGGRGAMVSGACSSFWPQLLH